MTRAQVVTAARGVRWVAEGWRLFRAAPLAWLALVFVYFVAMNLVALVPKVGVAGVLALTPAFSLGFMSASRAAASGEPVGVPLLLSGLRAPALRSQLELGLAYLACFALVLGASSLADGGDLARLMMGQPQGDGEAQVQLSALLAVLALYLPVMLLFWFAPVLAAWHSFSPGKAMFYSVAACLVNWRAFLAYGATVAVLTLLLPALVLSALSLIGAGAAAARPAAIGVPLLVVLMPALFASFYASYQDIFDPPAQGV